MSRPKGTPNKVKVITKAKFNEISLTPRGLEPSYSEVESEIQELTPDQVHENRIVGALVDAINKCDDPKEIEVMKKLINGFAQKENTSIQSILLSIVDALYAKDGNAKVWGEIRRDIEKL